MQYLGAFAKLWIATVSFIISVRPSVSSQKIAQLHETDFHEIFCWIFLLNYVKKVQVWLRRTNTASASHKELRVYKPVTPSYRLRQTCKKSVPKYREFLYRELKFYMWNVWSKREGHTDLWWENLKKRHHLIDLGINGRIIFKHRINPDHDRSMWQRPLNMVKNLQVP
jgi:hypothetical protein